MKFGNPSYHSMELIKNSQLLREWSRMGIFAPLLTMPYPDEMTTKKELWMITAMSSVMDSQRLAYCVELDKDLFGVMSQYLGSYGVTVSTEEIKATFEPYEPIIDFLKAVYNRPRPFQTAAVYDIPLYPKIQDFSGESSYPGGHTLFSLFFYHFYGNQHPELKPELMKFVLDVKLSREQLGVHYPSDGLFSFQVYRHLQQYMGTYDTINRPT